MDYPLCTVGEINCVPDPATNSTIVPSVVSFLKDSERPKGKKPPSDLSPHPWEVVVGQLAKKRIESHPQSTLYHAKRIIGRPPQDDAIDELTHEVEFAVVKTTDETSGDTMTALEVPHNGSPLLVLPQQVGGYVINHLIEITKEYLGYDTIKSAVIAVPAKFNGEQRRATAEAFKLAGIGVARTLEEPVAAALAYGLHKKAGVDHILVYDFGGGTLDVSLLHVTEGFADVLGNDGDNQLGGADFDAAVSKFLMSRHAPSVESVTDALQALAKAQQQQGDNAASAQTDSTGSLPEDLLLSSSDCPALSETPLCTFSTFHTIGEKLKIQLSAFHGEPATVSLPCMTVNTKDSTLPTSPRDLCASLEQTQLSLTTDDFETAVRPLFERAILPVTRLLDDLGLHPEDVDEVVMVGGTTRMPQIRELVKGVMQIDRLNTHIDPDITVAYGAASVID